MAKKKIYNKKAKFKWLIKCRYGLSIEDFDKLVIGQSGRCAACLIELRKFHVDHDHQTGSVRGLLCHMCNVGVSYIERGLHERWIAYLSDTPYSNFVASS